MMIRYVPKAFYYFRSFLQRKRGTGTVSCSAYARGKKFSFLRMIKTQIEIKTI